MEQAWLLPAIPVAAFVVVALFNGLIPRRGDWLVILGMLSVVVIGAVIALDFQGSFDHGVFAPGLDNVYSF